jgi:nucleoside-diphosphate-sugar epimerase
MITGGTGFIASYLVRRFIERGEKVVVFDFSSNFTFIKDLKEKIKFIQGDVSNFDEVINAIRENDVESIFHMASILIGASNIVPLRATKVNAIGTANILEASRIMDLKKVIFTSSFSVFSEYLNSSQNLTVIDDESPKYPSGNNGIYGATKLLGELYGLWYAQRYGLEFRGVRYWLVYGPGDPYTYHPSRIITYPALGRPVEIPYPPNFTSNWLYVKDASEALIRLFDAQICLKKIYNIGGENCAYQEVASKVQQIIPDAIIKFKYDESTPLKGALFQDSYARDELGWKPLYSLEKGIQETIDETRTEGHYSKGVFVKDESI